MSSIRHLALFASTWLVAACGGGLQVRLVDATRNRPSNVAMYFTVDTDEGEPVPGLTAESFRIYEDGQLVSVYESKQTILNPRVAAVHYTLLLVDMSGSIVDSGQVPQLVAASEAFSERVGRFQQVAIYSFDGREDIDEVAGFTRHEGGVRSALQALENRQTRDPSTNLHGAVVKAIEVLKAQMDRSSVPLRFGTLVVFTDGTDRAGRVSGSAMMDAIDEADFDVYAIGVGGEIDAGELEQIGRDGFVQAQNGDQIARAFEQVARRIEGFSRRFYLLSYCTPARAGEHDVTIEAEHREMRGSVEYRFSADGFGPNCDPNNPPNFEARRRTAAREESSEGE